MLSSTSTITDVKKELEIFSFYDYDNDTNFVSALTYASEEAARFMKKYISESYYAQIQAMDKTGFDIYQDYIYQAEICFICFCFLSLHDRKELFKRRAAEESISDGFSRSMSGPTGKALAADAYYSKGLQNLRDAGYHTSIRLGRNAMSAETNLYPREFN